MPFKITREAHFLISLCKSEKVYQQELLLDYLPRVNWETMIRECIRHKMLPTLFYHLMVNYEKLTTDKYLSRKMMEFIIANCDLYALKKHVFLTFAEKITSEFHENQLPLVTNKGIILESTVHYADGRRQLGDDIDFMILPEDRNKTVNLMKNLGFVNGKYDVIKKKIVEKQRKDLILYNLYPDHLPPFILETHNLALTHVYVDFANSFTWHGSNYEISMMDAFENRELIEISFNSERFNLVKLSVYYEFAFLAMHIFREAWFISINLEGNNDVNLVKFFDIYQYLKQKSKFFLDEAFSNMLSKYMIEKPVSWVIYHTDQIFGSTFHKDLNLTDLDEAFLNGAFNKDGVTIRWKGNMLSRLFSKNRTECFENICS